MLGVYYVRDTLCWPYTVSGGEVVCHVGGTLFVETAVSVKIHEIFDSGSCYKSEDQCSLRTGSRR